MALTTEAQIKELINYNSNELFQSSYPEDFLAELAESELPIYNNEIIQEWVELPHEDRDQWKELGYDTQRNEGGILQLMIVDLAIYYNRKFSLIWEEIKAQNAN